VVSIKWRFSSDRSIAPFDGETQLPYSVCSIGPETNPVYEAWDCRTNSKGIIAHSLGKKEAMQVVLTAIKENT
jgi:hypothetical protein